MTTRTILGPFLAALSPSSLLVGFREVICRTPLRLLKRVAHQVLDRLARYPTMDVERARQELAVRQSAAFVNRRLANTRVFCDRFQLLDACIRRSSQLDGGLVCEFGVYRGEGLNFIASRVAGPVHGFDSFLGLPETYRNKCEVGAFRLAKPPRVRSNVKLHIGWFADTLPAFKKEYAERARLLHIDCDLYSSTVTVLAELSDRIVPGTVIVFDEFFNYPGWRQGEYRAFTEFVEEQGVCFEYVGYCRHGQQVAVRITEKGDGPNRQTAGSLGRAT
jgi:hypothetical protein